MTDELVLYDAIGEDQSTARFVLEFLRGCDGDVIVAINSVGGDVFEAEAIFGALRRHDQTKGPVTVRIDGLAASAASYIAMAGRDIVMAPGAMMMIHSPLAFTMGNREHLKDIIDRLEKVESGMVRVYAKRTGLDEEKIRTMLAEETWLTAEEALEFGFINRIDRALELAASVYGDLSRYRHVPIQIAAMAKFKLTPEQQSALARANLALAKIQNKNEEKEVSAKVGGDTAEVVAPLKRDEKGEIAAETEKKVFSPGDLQTTPAPPKTRPTSAAAMRLKAQSWRLRLSQPAS